MDGATESLERLAAKIDKIGEQHGIERERRSFRPHVTLGRVKRPHGSTRLLEGLAATAVAIELPPARAFVLFESERSSDGPRYTALESFSLRD